MEIYRTDLGCYLANPSAHARPSWGIIVFKTRSKVLLCWMLAIWQDKDGMRTDDINALAGQRADKKPGAPGRQPSTEHLVSMRQVFFFWGGRVVKTKKHAEMQIIVLFGKDCVRKCQVPNT